MRLDMRFMNRGGSHTFVDMFAMSTMHLAGRIDYRVGMHIFAKMPGTPNRQR